jgi:beta-N-acetylhexosaminidase
LNANFIEELVMAIGHIMLDICGVELSSVEKEILRHPQVGGIILFSRNYESKTQLNYLTKDIHKLAPDCLIAVDQEGGRVQRFRLGFTALPSFKEYGERYAQNPSAAKQYAHQMAYTMAQELKSQGVDLSFSPVLDIDYGVSEVIGDRSFHRNHDIVTDLANAFIDGMHEAGMPATGKHFPGHGGVQADSHTSLPVDDRSYDTIFENDIQPFLKLAHKLGAIMPAHIVYENVDSYSAGFSSFWLRDVLRSRLNFSGVIFSDDLSMAGAECVGDYIQRANHAITAGCDMILICNQPEQAIRVLEELEHYENPESQHRLKRLRK